ncbi:MAG: TIGR02281 family clan AA aspartic protease [Kiloniellaceae bacterium]
MTREKDPWNRRRRDAEPPGARRGHGLWLWLLLVAALAGLVWLLLSLFPQRELGSADWAQVVKLSAILVLFSSGFLFLRRVPMGETLRNLAIWAGIGGLLLIGYAYRDDFSGLGNRLSGELLPSRAVEVGDGVVEIRAGMNGHFVVTASVNGRPVDFLVDTGASDVVLSPADARRIGYDPDRLSFTRQYYTANGVGRGAPVRLDSIAVGPIVFNGLPASVNEAPMSESLLGMSFLRQLDSYEVRRDLLILRR